MRLPAVLLCFLFVSCIYEAPLTKSPTRKIDERLIGDWVSVEEKPSVIQIRKFDDSNFILIDGGSVYRVFHSDFEGVNFLSLQNLNTKGSSARKFAFIDYRFEEPDRVRARAINQLLIKRTLLHGLFPLVRAEILRLLFTNLGTELYTRELAPLSSLALRTVQDEVAKLEAADLIVSRSNGYHRFYRANPRHPLYRCLAEIVCKGAEQAKATPRPLPSRRSRRVQPRRA